MIDFSKLATQARALKDASFYPTIDISLILMTIAVICRSRQTAAAVAHRQASPLVQCCYTMLSVLAIIQCSSWTEAHFPLSVAVLPLLILQPTGYYPFQLVNLIGIYRSLSGHTGVDIWHQILYATMHSFLLLENLDAQGQRTLNDLKQLVFYTQERRLLSIQSSRDIRLEDLDELPWRMNLSSIAKEFKYNVNESFFVIRAIFRATWRPMIPIYILDSLLNIATVGSSVLDNQILKLVDAPLEHSWYEGYIIIILAFFAKMFTMQFSWIESRIIDESNRIAKAIELELFRLPLTNSGLRKEHSLARAKSIVTPLPYHFRRSQAIVGILTGIVATIVPIYTRIGWVGLVPLAVSATVGLLKRILSKLLGTRNQWISSSSKVKYKADVGEIFHNIKSIKMFGWERMYVDRRLQKHWSEAADKSVVPWYAPIVRFVWFVFDIFDDASDKFSVYITIYLFTISSSDSTSIISSAEMFQLNVLMNKFIDMVMSFNSRLESVRWLVDSNYKLEKVLRGDFVDSLPHYPLDSEKGEKTTCCSRPSVALENCDFAMKRDVPTLKGISFKASDGELVAVVGKTGSGKSSLLLSICGEVKKTRGSGAVYGSTVFMEQSPWIINDTIRENILFGHDYEEDHYNKVVEACALADDLKTWANGDRTVIGERGINISGGQRARLALARTVYSKADIYILDDPLSAVDAHVKRHILEHVIMDSGLLGGKLRIISINAESLLPYFDQVIRLNDGKLSAIQQVPQKYRYIANNHPTTTNGNSPGGSGSISSQNTTDNKKCDFNKDLSSLQKDSTPKIREWNKWSNLKYAIKICGPASLLMITLAGFVKPIFYFIIDGYKLDSLKSIHSGGKGKNNDAVLSYLFISMLDDIMCGMLVTVDRFIRRILTTNYLEPRIKSMFVDSMIHAPLSFFDSTTSTDLTSAYDSGCKSISKGITSFLMTELSEALGIILLIYRVARNAPLLLLAIPLFSWYGNKHISYFDPIKASLYNIRMHTRVLNNKTRNIIAGGKRLIRLLNVEPYFTALHMEGMDNITRVQRAQEAIFSMSGATSKALDKFSYSIFHLCILAQNQLSGHWLPSNGFIAYTSFAQMLIYNTIGIIELPSRLFLSNEGINIFRQYMEIDREDILANDAVKPSSDWPSEGTIEFRNFSMKYHNDLEYALKNINLTIKPGEKIGIVGRTGAGKTSLSRAIFRLISSNTCEGSILIDGCDISSIKLGDLRPKLGTIPQESTLFKGSFKQNLDPLMQFTIEDMWAALIKCSITEFVVSKDMWSISSDGDYNEDNDYVMEEMAEWDHMWQESDWQKCIFLWLFIERPQLKDVRDRRAKHGLDKDVGNQSQLSSGQKQLFSLCRLLMRKCKIIVLDEATADVDTETDRDMQKLFRSEFKDSTVLTIAHRLETIMSSDRIIVMNEGRVAEIGPPKELIKQNSYFAELVKANNF